MQVYLIAACCLTIGSALAEERALEVRLGAGVDIVHRDGMGMASASAGPFSLLAWSGNYGAALSYSLGPRVGWNAAVGFIVARRTGESLGTRANALLRGSYCGERLCLSFAHMSHGADLGIATEKHNDGLNFLYLELRP